MDKRKETYEIKEQCKSVFKSGESAPSISQYTEKWIELINRIERRKNFSL